MSERLNNYNNYQTDSTNDELENSQTDSANDEWGKNYAGFSKQF